MFITLCGVLSIAWVLYRLYNHVSIGVRNFILTNNVDFSAFGQWAVVTGATGGMGKAFVSAFASRGLNVYLLGRSEDSLAALHKEMSERYPQRQFKTLCIDFSKDDALDYYGKMRSALASLDIGVLVNNAGRCDDLPGLMHEMPVELGVEMLQTNTMSLYLLAHCVLEGMQRRRRGAVITVSSFASMNVCPRMSTYGATKAFATYLTRSLESEYAQHGVRFECLLPSFVQTKMAGGLRDASKPDLLMPSAEAYVASALNTFGVSVTSSGYWFHGLFATIISLLPCGVSRDLGDKNMDEMVTHAKNLQKERAAFKDSPGNHTTATDASSCNGANGSSNGRNGQVPTAADSNGRPKAE
ncbi:very-long-chain 3-oxoacyl-CoA reductase-like [Sycon ciliatum]|uniref:very-long-chain 3-oxoacyl-CoA reductase-like n=1 Tax=Sycon ciliatum TaxID=27933 RepID=UPI0031F649CF